MKENFRGIGSLGKCNDKCNGKCNGLWPSREPRR